MIPLCLVPRATWGAARVFPSEGGMPGSFGRSPWCRHPAAVTHSPQKFIHQLEELKGPGDLEGLALTARYRVATSLLSNVEEFLRTLAKALPAGSLTYHSPSDTGEASSCPAPAPALAPSCLWIPQPRPFSPQSCP